MCLSHLGRVVHSAKLLKPSQAWPRWPRGCGAKLSPTSRMRGVSHDRDPSPWVSRKPKGNPPEGAPSFEKHPVGVLVRSSCLFILPLQHVSVVVVLSWDPFFFCLWFRMWVWNSFLLANRVRTSLSHHIWPSPPPKLLSHNSNTPIKTSHFQPNLSPRKV